MLRSAEARDGARGFFEVETGKGSNALASRPQLRNALYEARSAGATLLIAKLDRLSRNVHFITGLIESGVSFKACDMPEANKMMLHIHAVMAENERDQISQRTREALHAAKLRGVSLGRTAVANGAAHNARRREEAKSAALALAPVLEGWRREGLSLRQIGNNLKELELKPALGDTWHPTQVSRLLRRCGLLSRECTPTKDSA